MLSSDPFATPLALLPVADLFPAALTSAALLVPDLPLTGSGDFPFPVVGCLVGMVALVSAVALVSVLADAPLAVVPLTSGFLAETGLVGAALPTLDGRTFFLSTDAALDAGPLALDLEEGVFLDIED